MHCVPTFLSLNDEFENNLFVFGIFHMGIQLC
jgi:hypothetical protein